MKEKEIYEKEIIEVIKEKKLCFISHIFGFYTELGKSQFYNLKLDESDDIRAALNKNRSKGCGYLLNKWISSDNATLQIAAMRLICEPEERQKLNQQYVEMTGKNGKELIPENVKLTTEQIDALINKIETKQ